MGYELVCVARLMQPSGPPTLVEVDSILWGGLNVTEELSRAGSLQASTPVTTLTEAVLQRLRDIRRLPCELWLYRDGQHVFAGPLTSWSRTPATRKSAGRVLLESVIEGMSRSSCEDKELAAGICPPNG